jgi:hypothetical protein
MMTSGVSARGGTDCWTKAVRQRSNCRPKPLFDTDSDTDADPDACERPFRVLLLLAVAQLDATATAWHNGSLLLNPEP